MSYVQGITMTIDLLETQVGSGSPTAAQVREALGEDFPAEEFQSVARWWLNDYGVRASWRAAVEDVAGGRP